MKERGHIKADCEDNMNKVFSNLVDWLFDNKFEVYLDNLYVDDEDDFDERGIYERNRSNTIDCYNRNLINNRK